MPRIPLLDEADAPEAVREALATMPPSGTVFRMVAHAETLFRPFLALTGVIQTGLALDPRLRQLAILRVAALTGCEYERVQQEVIAKLEGVSPEQIAAVARFPLPAERFDERELLVLRFVEEAVENWGAGEAITAQLAAQFPPREIIELLMVIWQYLGISVLLNTTALEPQPPLSPEAILAARARRAALNAPGPPSSTEP